MTASHKSALNNDSAHRRSIDESSLLNDRITAMRKQESTLYLYNNYFMNSEVFPRGEDICYKIDSWREKICHWTYSVIDHFELSRDTVAVSLVLFDRYLATQGKKCDGSMTLLLSLTTLYIAIKTHEKKKVKLSTLANLSRGHFGPADIEKMEIQVLSALTWLVHPPTAVDFISHLVLLLPGQVCPYVRNNIFELSRYLAELSVCDSFFVEYEASTIAFAAILNVMDDIKLSGFSPSCRDKFIKDICQNLKIDYERSNVTAARLRLRVMFEGSVLGSPHREHSNSELDSILSTPRAEDMSEKNHLSRGMTDKVDFVSNNKIQRGRRFLTSPRGGSIVPC